jgi:hypothetical protein
VLFRWWRRISLEMSGGRTDRYFCPIDMLLALPSPPTIGIAHAMALSELTSDEAQTLRTARV